MEARVDFAEPIIHDETTDSVRPRATLTAERSLVNRGQTATNELDIWLRALQSFFNPRHHAFTETERTQITTRDFANETRIALGALLHCSQLILAFPRAEFFISSDELRDAVVSDTASLIESVRGIDGDAANRPLVLLAEAFNDASTLCQGLLAAPQVSFHAWASLGKFLTREVNRSRGVQQLMSRARRRRMATLHPALLALCERVMPGALGTDLRIIFSNLAQLLEHLRFIETLLRCDQPLKQSLLIFSLVHEETRALIDLIETRAIRKEELDGAVFDTLDGIAYAIGMELRKAFEHELIGLGALRQAPLVYAKVENAHGLLRDCFQQSTVVLAQTFDSTLDGGRLFQIFQTKLEQSLALRRDLWMVLQLVRRAERERDRRPVATLLERLEMFREGSLRYLMYKDWESYERFLEEIAAARGAVEVAPVLHRFGAYLETLFGQINMRAVLANDPFDSPALED